MTAASDRLPSAGPRLFDWFVLAGFVASLPFLIYGMLHVRSDTADVTQWLPAGTNQRTRYEWFVENFGIDDYMIVSWDGCTPEDPRLEAFAGAVRKRLGPDISGEPLVAEVRTTEEVLERLESPPLSLPENEARHRLAGSMIGGQTGTAAAFLKVTPEGKRQNGRVVDTVYDIAEGQLNLPADQVHLGGSVYEAVVIDRESLASMKKFILPSGIAVLLLALISVRDLRLAAIMLVVSMYCQLMAVAVVYWCDASLDAALMIMPTLVYVITMSGALHLVNYYRHAVEHGEKDPAGWTLGHGWRPCTAASITTALGLASLMLSQVRPVRLFGMYSALNVILALGVLLLTVPCGLRIFGGGAARTRSATLLNRRSARKLTMWIIRRHSAIEALTAILVIGAGLGLTRLHTSLNLQHMFPADSPLVQNYAWLEHEVGPLIAIEIVLAFPHDADIRMIDQFETVRAVEKRVADEPDVEATMSAMTFVPPLPSGKTMRSILGRSLFVRKLEERKESFIADGVMADDGVSNLWRITAHVSALAGHEYGELAERIRQDLKPVLDTRDAIVRENMKVYFTGLTPIVYRAQRQMLSDLLYSFLGAFALICPLMMLQLGGVVGGLVAMIPNVAPVALVFGLLGWFQVPIDIGVVLTASVGLGIAVDGTLHFVGWYKGARRRGLTRDEALASSYRTCATAMTQTTLVCGLGLLVFGLSDFIPTARFAMNLMCLLLVALASDLIFMPALISGRLGRWIDGRLPLADTPDPEHLASVHAAQEH